MASETDICNLALAYLGDDANVNSISPPDASAQAQHCARFYAVARDTVMDAHQWNFCTFRAVLAPLASTPPSSWAYAYAVPNGLIDLIAVLDSSAANDYSTATQTFNTVVGLDNCNPGTYTPQPFVIENDDQGHDVIYTNQVNAVARYTKRVTDTTLFPALFVEAVSWLLASKLAGPILKGSTGAKAAMDAIKMYQYWMAQATVSDASNRKVQVAPHTAWIANR